MEGDLFLIDFSCSQAARLEKEVREEKNAWTFHLCDFFILSTF